MAFQRSAVHLKSLYAEENEQTSEVAEHELTHLEISLKVALHGPAVFLRFLPAAHYEMPSKTARDCQFNLLAFSRADSDAPRPDAPKQRAFTHTQVFINCFVRRCGRRFGREGRLLLRRFRLSPDISRKNHRLADL